MVEHPYPRLRFNEQAQERYHLLYKKAKETNSLESFQQVLEGLNSLFDRSPGSYVKLYTDWSLGTFALGWTVCNAAGEGIYYGGLVYHESSNVWASHS